MRKIAPPEHPPSASVPADELDADVIRMREALRALGRQASLRDPIGGAVGVYDLTPPQAHTILALGVEGSLTMGQLSRRCACTEKTMTGIVDRLEQAGHVARERDSADRRVVKVRLTPEGLVVFGEVERFLHAKLKLFLSFLDHDERAALSNIIAKISDRLAARAADAGEDSP